MSDDHVPPSPESGDLVTIPDAMRQLRCGRRKIFDLADEGKLELKRLGHRTVRVTQRSLDRIIAKLDPVPPGKR